MPRIGLISDTHTPDRYRGVPPRVFELLAGVDLLIHAGDVGALWVLDQLSAIAPVIAVHGNDETDEATLALPYLQTLCVAGQRLVVTHAHYPDRAQELASRSDQWNPHFERRADFAEQHGASIIVFGHLHIPMCLEHRGVLLINPGAIASGNPWMRQLIQTVAILTLETGKSPQVTHYDLNTGEEHIPYFSADGFAATYARYNTVILSPELYAAREWLWSTLRPMHPDVHESLLRPGHLRWDDQRSDLITPEEMAESLKRGSLPAAVIQALREHPLFAPYMD